MELLSGLIKSDNDQFVSHLKNMFSNLTFHEIESQLETIPPRQMLESFITICKRICQLNEDDKNQCDNLLEEVEILKNYEIRGSEWLLLTGLELPLRSCKKICINLTKSLNEDVENYLEILRIIFLYLADDELSLHIQSVLMSIFKNKPKFLTKVLSKIEMSIMTAFVADPSIRMPVYELILQCSYEDSSLVDDLAGFLSFMAKDCLSNDYLMQQATIQLLLEFAENSNLAGRLISLLNPLTRAFELLSPAETNSSAQRGYIQLCSVVLVAGRDVLGKYLSNYVENVLAMVEKSSSKLLSLAVFDSFSLILRNNRIFNALLEESESNHLRRLADMSFLNLKSPDSHFLVVRVLEMCQTIAKFNENAEKFFELMNCSGDLCSLLCHKCSSLETDTSLSALKLIKSLMVVGGITDLMSKNLSFQEYVVKVLMGRSFEYNECKYEIIRLLVDGGYSHSFGERRQRLIDIYNGGPLYNPHRFQTALD